MPETGRDVFTTAQDDRSIHVDRAFSEAGGERWVGARGSSRGGIRPLLSAYICPRS